jgi:asparagine synthase (glutamine-hydrolysing)
MIIIVRLTAYFWNGCAIGCTSRPDDEGYFVQGPVGLGMRRLAIIDLRTGHQPIANEDETIRIIFNGEIYNYPELKKQLLQKGHSFRTRSDTEVIIHLYEEEGEACLARLRGMFAFALWDSRRQKLLLARDHVGIKPLYMRAFRLSHFRLRAQGHITGAACVARVRCSCFARLLSLGYVRHANHFRTVRKLPPGYLLCWQMARRASILIGTGDSLGAMCGRKLSISKPAKRDWKRRCGVI